MDMQDGETLADYAKRISEKLKADTAERRDGDSLYDAKCRMEDTLEAQGCFENVTRTAFALNPEVTFSAYAMTLELPGLAGHQLRVVSEAFSLVNASYSDVLDRAGGVEALTVKAVRQLMLAQREQAQKWLEAHPEETT